MIRFQTIAKFHLPSKQLRSFINNPDYMTDVFAFVKKYDKDRGSFQLKGISKFVFGSSLAKVSILAEGNKTTYIINGKTLVLSIHFFFEDPLRIEFVGEGRGIAGKISDFLFKTNFEKYIKYAAKKLREYAGC